MRHSFFRFLILPLVALLGCSRGENNTNRQDYITQVKEEGVLTLAEGGSVCPVICSARDEAGVLRAAGDLARDFERVTGQMPRLIIADKNTVPEEEAAILVGTLGESPLIDSLVGDGRLNVDAIRGKWESSATTVVEDPLPGISRALVIAGSDKRGTIYGIYELSARIGVSPWYFWADVTPEKRESLFARPGTYILDEPAVKYRGIFINDEAPALAGWVHEHYGSFNHEFYEHVFELILRMKGNYLWPAMWGRAFYDDDPENARMADEYGVVIGTSHHEPLMRAHVEWARYGNGPWDYSTNSDTLRKFWREGIARMGDNESIVTIGMRGDGDAPMTEGTAIALLERIVDDQRTIIEEETGKPAEETPQMWALYKEVQEYYDKGMRVPDDVTLLLCDDNWGNLRKLPRPGTPERAGGYGIYYHFDYVGGPRNYKWLNTNQIERTWEQMHMAWEHGVDRIWIVNVGDIKPMEFPTQFFLDLAWDPGRWNGENLKDYYVEWSRQQFGEQFAEPVADILASYTKYNARRKPELLSPETYSLTHFREAERIVADYRDLEDLAEFIGKDIPDRLRDAYFQLVLFPVKACANLNDLYVTAAWNGLYGKQGRAATNVAAERVGELFEQDSLLTLEYHTMGNGKWNHMMSQTHIGYRWWQEPRRNRMPRVSTLDLPAVASMGVAVEQDTGFWPGTVKELHLPAFDRLNGQEYYVDIFNRGTPGFPCTLEPSDPWIRLSGEAPLIETGERIYVSIDWARAPKQLLEGSVQITGPGDEKTTVSITADNRDPAPPTGRKELFIENNGIVSMEAVHYQRKYDGKSTAWSEVENLGRTLSAMITLPSTAAADIPGGNSPRLEYDFYTADTGSFVVETYLSPTLKFYENEALHFAVSLDDLDPVTLVLNEEDQPGIWNAWVANNIIRRSTEVTLEQPGVHTFIFWRVDPAVVLQKTVIRRKGTDDPSYLGPPESLLVNQEPPLPH
jgi:hypothetical protein